MKVAYKPGLDYLLECFLPSTFARIISVVPEKFFVTGGAAALPPPPGPHAFDWKKHLNQSVVIFASHPTMIVRIVSPNFIWKPVRPKPPLIFGRIIVMC